MQQPHLWGVAEQGLLQGDGLTQDKKERGRGERDES